MNHILMAAALALRDRTQYNGEHRMNKISKDGVSHR